MEILYVISIVILFVSFILAKKSEKEINIINCIFISIILLLCYNAFVCYILTFFIIPVELWSLSIINLIISLIFIIPIIKTKDIQKYFFKKIDLLYICIIALVVIIISYIFFDFPFNVNYESGDSTVHYLAAVMFAKSDSLLAATTEFDEFYGTLGGMKICSYVNSGLIMKCCCENLDPIECYNVFVGFDIFTLFLTGVIFYFSLRNFATEKEHLIWITILSVICILGYPLNSLLFGFEYLSLGLLILSTIINIMYYYSEKNFKFSFIVISMLLLNFGLFSSYYMFVPFVYPALWIYFCIENYCRTKKIITKNLIILLAVTLLLPFILGFIYYMAPDIYSILINKNANINANVDINTIMQPSSTIINSSFKVPGYTYINLYSNMILLIPATIYLVFKDRKSNKFILLLNVFCILFIELLLIGNVFDKISIYYISKNYYALWIILLYGVGKTLIMLSKKGKYLPRLFIITYIFLMIISIPLSNIKVEYILKNEKENITSVMEIFQANKTILFNKPAELNKNEIELVKYAQKNLEHNKKTEVICDENTYYWTYVLLRFTSKENEYKESVNGQRALATKNYYISEEINNVDYMIYFTSSNKYKELQDKLFENATIIYENSAGGILKYNN